jgi:hypothetical protein
MYDIFRVPDRTAQFGWTKGLLESSKKAVPTRCHPGIARLKFVFLPPWFPDSITGR